MKEEITHSFELEDVRKYGSIEKALLMKEFRRMSTYKLRNGKHGWVYYSATALEEKFSYMAKTSIKRWLDELVADGYLQRTVRNKMKYDRTYSYMPSELVNEKPKWESVDQNGPSMDQNGPTIPPLSTPLSVISETEVSRKSSISAENSEDGDVVFEEEEDLIPTSRLRKKNKPVSMEPQIKKLWKLWPGLHGQWQIDRTIRKSSEVLLKEREFEKIEWAVEFWLEHKDDPFCPDCSTPYKLASKWDALRKYKQSLKK